MAWSAVVAFVVVAGCARQASTLSDADLAAIRHRFDEVVRHVSAQDYAGRASDFTPDGVLMVGNTPALRGRAAIQKWAETGPKVTSPTFTDLQIQGQGDWAWATSAYSATVEGVADAGKQLIVLQRQADGSWLVVAASVSSDIPVPGAGNTGGAEQVK